MTNSIITGAVDHLRLTVTDIERARDFYVTVLGFQIVMDTPTSVLLSNGSLMLGMGPAPDTTKRDPSDRFDENRVGLDHLSFSVGSRADLEHAIQIFDTHGVPHGDIKDIGPEVGIYILAFRDPDNIQLELTAPYGSEQ